MSTRALSIAVALAAAAILTPAFTASAKDDPAAQAAAKEAVKKDLKAKGFYYSFDLSYFVDAPKLKETRWEWKDPPPFNGVSEKQGGQFYATWSSGSGAGAGITLVVNKLPHFERNGNSQSNFSYPFKSWGKDVQCSKVDDMAAGFYEDWIREATEVNKDKCKATKKRNLGPAEYFSTAVGTDKEDKVRQRKMWFVWGTSGAGVPCTWVATATIADKFIDTEEIHKKAEDMIAGLKELKDGRLK